MPRSPRKKDNWGMPRSPKYLEGARGSLSLVSVFSVLSVVKKWEVRRASLRLFISRWCHFVEGHPSAYLFANFVEGLSLHPVIKRP